MDEVLPVPPSVSRFLREIGRRGGTARAANLSKRELVRQAKHAASFRRRKKKKPAG